MDHIDHQTLLAALAWQVEMGVDEAIGDDPVDRYSAPPPPEPVVQAPPVVQAISAQKLAENEHAQLIANFTAQAHAMAAGCATLPALHDAMQAFDGCTLKQGARNFVFSDGHASARLMIVGEAPGRDEDREGRPFVGRSGQLLDKMLAAIGRDRSSEAPDQGAYITNVMPWRPPANRDPVGEEVAMMRPFLLRHITLAQPDCLLLLGNSAMKTLFEVEQGITAMRGQWREVAGVPAIASFHPAALLRNGLHKKSAWQDLLHIKSRLDKT
ncbi:DNA polymerase [Monaibacterium marinum]|uniref:Type-4 uracil-DNA glycosylase n=1 Tax=Pontivivens marinum TaxID=1690039 RepID=A0A2C9CNS4_9RHOB|nr:DNA polymerase [Monaibacterium marinum]